MKEIWRSNGLIWRIGRLFLGDHWTPRIAEDVLGEEFKGAVPLELAPPRFAGPGASLGGVQDVYLLLHTFIALLHPITALSGPSAALALQHDGLIEPVLSFAHEEFAIQYVKTLSLASPFTTQPFEFERQFASYLSNSGVSAKCTSALKEALEMQDTSQVDRVHQVMMSILNNARRVATVLDGTQPEHGLDVHTAAQLQQHYMACAHAVVRLAQGPPVRAWLQCNPDEWSWIVERASLYNDTPSTTDSPNEAVTVDALIEVINPVPPSPSTPEPASPDLEPADDPLVKAVTNTIQSLFNRQDLMPWAVEAIAAVGPKATQEATLEAAVHWLMEHHTELPSPSSRKRQKRDPREFTDVTDVIHFDPEMDSGNVTPQHQVHAPAGSSADESFFSDTELDMDPYNDML